MTVLVRRCDLFSLDTPFNAVPLREGKVKTIVSTPNPHRDDFYVWQIKGLSGGQVEFHHTQHGVNVPDADIITTHTAPEKQIADFGPKNRDKFWRFQP
jgi:hypothetical protein